MTLRRLLNRRGHRASQRARQVSSAHRKESAATAPATAAANDRYVSPVQWNVVATGSGDVWRPCNGNALNRYTVYSLSPFWYACG